MSRRVETAWGALLDGDAARFRLWAPGVETLRLELDGREVAMRPAGDGWFEAREPARAGSLYQYILPDGLRVPDPASRAQAEGVHGPSVVVDPTAYEWREASPARPWEEAVIQEIHVGTFTPEGTFAAAAERLPHLAETGFTAVELMPVAQFDGARGWGYDGVLLYAPHPAYGAPDDLRRFVEAAHRAGLMVLLDVVHNHFGPEGNYLGAYAPAFFDEDRHTPWGAGIRYSDPAVRRFFVDNALHWLVEYDLDGFRFDAIDHVRDPSSDVEILVQLAREIRALRPERPTWLTTEDNRNVTHLHERGGELLYDGEWNDDFHNAVHVAATGETEGYYADFADHPWTLLARSLAEGFAFQGGDADRGQPSAHLPPQAFVDFLQNHDQIGNRAMGERLTTLTSPEMLDALQTILILSPHVPLLFMGEEWGARDPFFFFTDFQGGLADAVREGRRREFASFSAFSDEAARRAIPDPNDPATFEASRLDWDALEDEIAAAHRERIRMLMRLRQRHLVPLLKRAGGHTGRMVGHEPGLVAVDWHIDGVAWRLRAHLGEGARGIVLPGGERIYGPAPGLGGELSAYDVIVTLDEDPHPDEEVVA